MRSVPLLAPATATDIALSSALFAAVAILVLVTYIAFTLPLLFPGCVLREALRKGDENTAGQASALRQSLADSRALAFAGRLMKHDWTTDEVVDTSVFVLTTTAAVFAILVAGYVLGLVRPAVADLILPWVLSASIAVSMAYARAHLKAEPWLGATVIACGIVAVTFIALLKVEATVIEPAVYLHQHPLKDRLMAPTRIAIEVGAFSGSALAHEGIGGTLRAVAALVAVAIEIVVTVLLWVVWLGELVIRGVPVVASLTLGLLLAPSELAYRAIRHLAGTDIHGHHHLPPPTGGALA